MTDDPTPGREAPDDPTPDDRSDRPGPDGPAADAPTLEEPGFVPTGKWASPAIYASNWRTILVVDALIGVAVLVVGLAMIVWWNWWLGSLVGALGLTYATAVGRRYLQWRWLRQQAGLDP